MKQSGHSDTCTCSNCDYYNAGAFANCGSTYEGRHPSTPDPLDKLRTVKTPGGAELVVSRRVDQTAPKFQKKPTEAFPREPNLLELEARITRLEKWTALPDAQQRSSSCDGPL